jgi:hypothetical protein
MGRSGVNLRSGETGLHRILPVMDMACLSVHPMAAAGKMTITDSQVHLTTSARYRPVPRPCKANGPADAEQALADVPAWADAPPCAVNTFAVANLRSFERVFRRLPDNEARRFQLDLARAWATPGNKPEGTSY